MTGCLLHDIMFLYYIVFPSTAITVTTCNNVQVSFTDRTVGSASNTGSTAETTSTEGGSGENRSNQNATNKNESEKTRPADSELTDNSTKPSGGGEGTPVTETPTESLRPTEEEEEEEMEEEEEEDEETLVEATLDPVSSTPDSNRRPKVVYAGELSCC